MISKQLKVDPSTITRDSRLIDDLKADSANIMVMIMDLEDQFGITVEDDQIRLVHSGFLPFCRRRNLRDGRCYSFGAGVPMAARRRRSGQ